MRAAFYERTGPASEVLQIGEVNDPAPAAGEVRVKMAWSGVNPSDVKSRNGASIPFPRIIPHSDGSGVIDQVGDGVDRSRIGQTVWLWNAAWQRPNGTAAEYCVVPQQMAVPLPDGVDPAAAACLGIPALTALHAVLTDGGVAGKNVLIAGGAGAVGHYAIQFAKLRGAARIFATVSSEEKSKLARDAGADVVVNYRQENVAEVIQAATSGQGIDRIIEVDLGANLSLDLQAIGRDREIVVYGTSIREIPIPFGPSILKNIAYRFFIVYNLSDADRKRAIDQLTDDLQHHRLQHNVAARLPLDRIAEAHQLVESGKVAGNVVLQI